MGALRSRLAQGLPPMLAGLAVACGARSGLDCLGESCQLAPGGAPGIGPGGSEPSSWAPGVGGGGFGAGGAGTAPGPSEQPPPSLGPDEPTVSNPEPSCALDGRFDGSIRVRNQRDLQRLEGCTEVTGNLHILSLITDDLRELNRLRQVGGTLQLRMSGSLEGLENLEAVGDLLLESLDAPTLAPLSNLRQIGTGDGDDGSLVIQGFERARDLAGLGGVQRVRSIEVMDAGALASLSGLALPARGVSRVYVANSPQLIDLTALSPLEELDELSLVQLNITSLAGLDNLRVASSLSLIEIPALADLRQLANLRVVGGLFLDRVGLQNLAGLEGLEHVDNLTLQNNPALVELDALAGLSSLDDLMVTENSALLRLPELEMEELFRVFVVGNASLEAGPSFPRASRIQLLTITGNAALTSLEGFDALRIAGEIEVASNAALTRLALNPLLNAGSLRIRCNDALPEPSLEPLRSQANEVAIYGNLGSNRVCEDIP